MGNNKKTQLNTQTRKITLNKENVEKKGNNIPKLKSNTAIIKPRQGFQNKTITRIQTPKRMSQNFKYYNIENPNLHIQTNDSALRDSARPWNQDTINT